jgi:hypothetical protein
MSEVATEKRAAVFVTVPSRIGKDRSSLREWSLTTEGGKTRDMVDCTLPHGTTLNGEDLSFYKFTVPAFCVDPGGQKYANTHSIVFSPDKETGEFYNVTLSRDFGAHNQNGEWLKDVKKVEVSPAELSAALKAQYVEYKKFRAEQKEAAPAANPTDARIAASTADAASMNSPSLQPHQKAVGVEHG